MPDHILHDRDAPFTHQQREYLSHEFYRLVHPMRVRFYVVLGLFMVVNLIGFPLALYLADAGRADLVQRLCANQNTAKAQRNQTVDVLEDIIRTSTEPQPGATQAQIKQSESFRTTQIARLETLRPEGPTNCSTDPPIPVSGDG